VTEQVPGGTLPHAALGRAWLAARVAAEVVYLDHAACSRQSQQTQNAVTAYCRREAEIGGYEAEAEAAALLDRGRAAIGELVGMAGSDVAFTTSASSALNGLLRYWPIEPGQEVGCAPGEYGPSLAAFESHGFRVRALPVDPLGRVDVDRLRRHLRDHRPALVHLTHVPSHRGIEQPAGHVGDVCRSLDIPFIIDAAQALGQVALPVGADAVYGTSRKWLCGPRGVGFVAVGPRVAATLHVPEATDPHDTSERGPVARLEPTEAHIGGRIGLCVAIDQWLDAAPEHVRDRLAALGRMIRACLDDSTGWRTVEPLDEPTAATTLLPPHGTNAAETQARLLAKHGILVALVPTSRAPGEMTEPVLRVSPHLDTSEADIDALATALSCRPREGPKYPAG